MQVTEGRLVERRWLQGKRGPELEVRDPEHVEERREKDSSQDEGQEENCLTRGEKGH